MVKHYNITNGVHVCDNTVETYYDHEERMKTKTSAKANTSKSFNLINKSTQC